MDRQGLSPPSAGLSTRRGRREVMGIVVSWSLIFWVIAAVVGFCALSFFLLQVAYTIAAEAPDVSIHARTPSPKDRKVEYPEADEAFRKKILKFGRRHSLPLDSPPPRSFVYHYRADVVETWKQYGAAVLNKVAILRASQGLERRFRKGLTTLRKIFSRSGSFIFAKSGGFFRRLGRGRAIIDRRAKAIGRLYSLRNH